MDANGEFDYRNTVKGVSCFVPYLLNCPFIRCAGPFINAFLEARHRNPSSSLTASIDGFLTIQVACNPTTSPSKAKIIVATCDHRECEFGGDTVLFDFVDRTRAKYFRSARGHHGDVRSQRGLCNRTAGQSERAE
jgi:hypothetical protein